MNNIVEIRKVRTKKEIRDFLSFPFTLYKGNKCYVPPLYDDEKKMFKKNYMYYDQSESEFFNAYKDGKIVGRIQAILQNVSNTKWNQKRVRFTRFDSINGVDVTKALFDAVENYAKEKNMEEVVGPLGFSDLEREGLLIEGFDQLNTFEEQYNHPYYQYLIEQCGYKKEIDWLEFRILPNKEKFEPIMKLGDRLLQTSGLHFVKGLNFKQLVKKYKNQFFELLDETYDSLYGTVPFTDGMKSLLINNFAPLINMDYFMVLVDKNDNIVAFCVAFPSISEDLNGTEGHLYPHTAIKLLKTVRNPRRVDLGLIGVRKKDSQTGAVAIIISELSKLMLKNNLEYYETNLNLENNKEILSMWKYFETIQHKRRRSFIKKMDIK